MSTLHGGQESLRSNQANVPEGLMRALAMQGALPDIIDPMIQLGITLADLRDFEYRWLRRTQTFEMFATVTLVAAQRPMGMLKRLTLGSRDMIAVVESITIRNTEAATQAYVVSPGGPGTVLGGATFPAANVDDRQQAVQQAFGLDFGTTAAGVGSFVGINVGVGAGLSVTVQGPWLLSGLGFLLVYGITVNTGASFSMRWYERQALQTER